MKSRFYLEMRAIKNELLALKCWAQKSAQVLRTTSISVPVQVKLGTSDGILRATQYVFITIKPTAGTLPILSATIDFEDAENRTFFFEGSLQNDGSFVYEFFLNSTSNPSDTEGTILNYNLVFTSTSQMEYEVEYRDV